MGSYTRSCDCQGLAVEQRRDPWESFRLWVALTIGLYAVRAAYVATWPGAIPGFVLALMVLVALALALRALLFPGRVVPWREVEGGLCCCSPFALSKSSTPKSSLSSSRARAESAEVAEAECGG